MNALRSSWVWLTQAQQWHGSDGIPARLVQHLGYTGLALLMAALIALPLGLLIGHMGRGVFVVPTLTNYARALPTLGLLVLLVIYNVSSSLSALIVLAALAVPPIVIATFEGVLGVDRDVKDAARGMGMTGLQVLVKVEIPMAMPLIMLGLQMAAITVVATATVAAYIGLGGLGRFIIDGLAQNDYVIVAGGAIVVVALALAVQVIFVGLRRLFVPAGLRQQASQS